MRKPLFILAVLGLFSSCNPSDGAKTSETAASKEEKPTKETPPPKSKRERLIDELKKLKSAVSSNNKDQMADFFIFPLSEDIISVHSEDPAYMSDYKKNGKKVTRPMFKKHFSLVSIDLAMEQMNAVFKQVKLDGLAQKDHVEREIRSAKEPCYNFYYIDIEKDEVSLTFGSNTNSDYVNPEPTNEEEDEVPEACEYTQVWVLKFDGTRLFFVKKLAAG